MTAPLSPQSGFSLLEALVALAVLAVAAAALVGAAEAHVDRIGGLEHRAAASWVAENQLAEIRIGNATDPVVEMVGETWRVDIETLATDDPDLARVTISVRTEADRQPAAVLTGFVDTGARR